MSSDLSLVDALRARHQITTIRRAQRKAAGQTLWQRFLVIWRAGADRKDPS